jgi:inosine/xanthosine triphosphate pyrophosphatase family protein
MPVHDITKLTLVTSNLNKLEEYRSFGLPDLAIAEGADLPEVDGSPDDVVIYKALAAGEGRIVEDTILAIDGRPVVDIRWQLAALEEQIGLPVRWDVRLGLLMDEFVHVYKASLDGVLVSPGGDGFGFDPFFCVKGEGLTLAELAAEGRKSDFSARKRAIERLVSGTPDILLNARDIPEWSGAFQH